MAKKPRKPRISFIRALQYFESAAYGSADLLDAIEYLSDRGLKEEEFQAWLRRRFGIDSEHPEDDELVMGFDPHGLIMGEEYWKRLAGEPHAERANWPTPTVRSYEHYASAEQQLKYTESKPRFKGPLLPTGTDS